jgi:hypothetical protein
MHRAYILVASNKERLMHDPALLDHTLDLGELHARHPVQFDHPHKRRIHEALPAWPRTGSVGVSRWAPAWPEAVPHPRGLDRRVVHGAFAYDDPVDDHVVHWYPNFADPDLFAFWDGPLLAQDELQALEHPTLGAIRQWLLAQDLPTSTVDADGRPTPWLLTGLPRRCSIDLSPSEERPLGLYGNRFQGSSWEQVAGAVSVLATPTRTNLVALSAPYGGRGAYTSLQIRWIVQAAYTAFAAAVAASGGRRVRLHTGFWGCGAFGGDRVLMTLAQWVAAAAAGVDQVVFHTLDPAGRPALAEAESLLAHLDPGTEPEAWVVALHGLDRRWGVGDGN